MAVGLPREGRPLDPLAVASRAREVAGHGASRHYCSAPADAAPGRDALGAHLAAGPARRRRRGRHERLRRRGRQAAGRRRHRGRDLHPRHRPAISPRSSSSLRACGCGTSPPARSRASPRPTCPRSCARSPPACCGSRRCTSPATSTSSTRTTGCPGRSGWLAKERWGVPLVHSACTRWRRSRTPRSPKATHPEPAARAIGEGRSSRPPTGCSLDTATRRSSWSTLYDADPRRVAHGRTRRRPRRLHARRRGSRPPRLGLDPRRARCCCSSAGSSRSRRPTCCCARPPS